MDGEFQQHEAKRLEKVQAQDCTDFTAELNDADNGRIKRFGIHDKQQQDKVRKEREKQTLSQALKISAAYAKLYNSTMQSLHDTRDVVYEAQLRASMALEQAQIAFTQTLEQASKTPDGVAVFRAADGNVYDENGQMLDDDTLMSVFFVDGAPSWEAHQERLHDVETKQGRLDLMNVYDIRIDEIQAKMEDEDNPPSTEEMKTFKEEIKAIKNDALKDLGADAQFNNTYSESPNAPPLNLKGFDI